MSSSLHLGPDLPLSHDFFLFAEVKQKGLDLGSRFAMGLILMAVLLIATGYLFRWRSPRQGEDSGDGSQGETVGDRLGAILARPNTTCQDIKATIVVSLGRWAH